MKKKYTDYISYISRIKIKEFENIEFSFLKNFLEDQKIKSKELRVMCSQMSILLESGASIDNTLELMLEQQKKRYKEKFYLSILGVKKGYSIENSFRSSGLFSEFFYNMIKCGENSGKLAVVLKDMSEYYERDYRVKSKLRSIMIYPAILIIMMFISLVFIIYMVIPNFSLVFKSNNITPPLFSRIVMNSMLFIRDYMNILIPIVLIIPIFIYLIFKGNEENIEKLDRLKCVIPLIKNYYLTSFSASFSRNMYIMLKSGIPFVDAIEIASDISGNKYIQQKFEVCIRYINKGNSISKSLKVSDIFNEMFVSMLKNGEQSGNIEKSFEYINNFFENELDIMTDRIIRLIEPAITIIMGIIIGGLIIAIVMPMFDAITAI